MFLLYRKRIILHIVLIILWFCRWLSAAFGFAITKAHIFPLEASRGTGQIVLVSLVYNFLLSRGVETHFHYRKNVTLPCLMFSKIVPAFTAQNISALGPIVAIAFLYEAIGLLMAWLVKQFFWLPHRFRYGILCAGAVSNYSDIRVYIQTRLTQVAYDLNLYLFSHRRYH